MLNLRLTILFLLFHFLSFYTLSQKSEDWRILERLCSSEFSGRGYVNEGDSKAADFIAAEFQKLGIQRVKRTYFQKFKFDVNTFPGELEFSINGKLLEPGKDYVVDPSSPTAKLKRETIYFNELFENTEQVFKGLKDLDKEKHVLVFDQRKFKTRDQQIALRTSVAKIGEIMPIILISEGSPTWHVSQSQMKFPVFTVSSSALEAGSIEMKVEAKLIQHKARNVIARIPANGNAKRRIVFTAHYDHLGRMGKNTFYAGANDNASGVTLMIAIARKIQALPKSETEYVFIAFAGEEVGLLGSHYFVNHPLVDLKSIRFLLNLDIFGGAHKSITAVNATVYKEEFNSLVQVNNEMNVTPEIKSRGETANSDHHWFHKAGVRCFFLYSGGDNPHYHVPWDNAKDVDLTLLDKTADLLVRFTQIL